jgi:tRNA threonylcarbamoyladenosine biosynthesis protein TsaB
MREFDPRGAGAVAAVAALLAEAGWKPSDLDAIAVSVGPGSFTGVRIGVSAAQGLCRGTDALAVPVGTLEGLAWAGRRSDWGLEEGWILASVDARRAEVYAALYRVHGAEPELKWGPEAISCVELARRFATAREDLKVELGVLAGDGAALLAPLFPKESGWAAPAVLDRPRANAVARAAARKLEKGETVAPAELAPVYLRKSDAEIRREQRLPAD